MSVVSGGWVRLSDTEMNLSTPLTHSHMISHMYVVYVHGGDVWFCCCVVLVVQCYCVLFVHTNFCTPRWLLRKIINEVQKWYYRSMLVFISVWVFLFPGALLVTMMIFCGGLFAHRSPHVSKAAILDYFNRRYPAPQYCTVKWDWTEPYTVGGTLTFQVQVCVNIQNAGELFCYTC